MNPVARLNAADRFMLLIDQTIRGLGGPGFETVTFVKLAGRANCEQLHRGILALSQTSPCITARLHAEVPSWETRPNAAPSLTESDLPTAEPQGILDYGSSLLAGETNPERVDPMRFHLLHLPDGNDVFVAQYSHVLLDHNHAVGALRRIDELSNATTPALPRVPMAWRDPVWAHLRQFAKPLRKRAAKEAGELRKAMRGGAMKLGRALPAGERAGYSILTRVLSVEDTRAVEERVRRTTGVPNLSMGLLASAFLGIDRLTVGRSDRGAYYQAGIALDLSLRNRPLDILENLATLIPLRVPVADATDRDGMTRLLARQLLEKLTSRTDVGVLQNVAAFGRQPSRARWVIDLLMRYCLCFWYGYLGPLKLNPTFCGAPVADVFSAGPTWPAVGITLLANQFAGQLHLQLTHVPQSVPTGVAASYLDGIVCDLLKS